MKTKVKPRRVRQWGSKEGGYVEPEVEVEVENEKGNENENPDEIKLEDEDDDQEEETRRGEIFSEEKGCHGGQGCGDSHSHSENPDEIQLDDDDDEDEDVNDDQEQKREGENDVKMEDIKPVEETTTTGTKIEEEEEEVARVTKFLALGKPGRNKDFLQVLDIPNSTPTPSPTSSTSTRIPSLYFDPHWLAIIRATNPYLSLTQLQTPFPPLSELSLQIDKEYEWVLKNVGEKKLVEEVMKFEKTGLTERDWVQQGSIRIREPSILSFFLTRRRLN